MYIAGEIEVLLVHEKIGFKKSIVSPEEHKALEKKLNDPENGIRSYVELLDWGEKELSKKNEYIALLKYVGRNFGTKISGSINLVYISYFWNKMIFL